MDSIAKIHIMIVALFLIISLLSVHEHAINRRGNIFGIALISTFGLGITIINLLNYLLK